MPVVPAAIASALAHPPLASPLRKVAGGAAIVAAAAVAIPVIATRPTLALAAPALVITAALASRFPAAAFVAVAFFAGFHGTITAHTDIPPRQLQDLFAGGLVAAALWRVFIRGRERSIQPTVPAILLSAFVVVSLLAVFAASDYVYALQSFRTSQWYLLLALSLWFAAWDSDQRLHMVRGLLLVGLAVAAYAALRWVTGPTAAEETLALETGGRFNLIDGDLRLVGSLATGSDLAAWTLITVPFAGTLALTLHGRWRMTAAVTTLLSFAVLLETGVRTGFVGVVAASVVVLVLYAAASAFGPARIITTYAAVAVMLGGGGAVFAATVLSDQGTRARFETLLRPGEDASFKARNSKWEAALADLDDRPLGHGLGTGGAAAVRYDRFVSAGSTSIDSSYLKVAVEQGFIVLGLLVAGLLALLWTTAVRARATTSPIQAAVLVAAAGSVAAWLVVFYAGTFIEGHSSLNGYLVLALGLAALGDNDA